MPNGPIFHNVDGVRYRDATRETFGAKRTYAFGKMHYATILPRIPDWPSLCGIGPQFLSDDSTCELRAGDCTVLKVGDTFQIIPERYGMTDPISIGELLSKTNTRASHVWLVARKDPTEDA